MRYFLVVIIFFSAVNLNAQNFKLFEKEIFVYQNDTLNYRILKPLNYDPNQLPNWIKELTKHQIFKK